jgi:RHS repeat-associated protein
VSLTGGGTPLTLGYGYCAGRPAPAQCTGNNGNVRSASIAAPGAAVSVWQTFDYDHVNRLTNASEAPDSGSNTTAWNQIYGYDTTGHGNRWLDAASSGLPVSPFTPRSASNFDANNWLVIQNSTYDLAGNQTAIGGFGYSYDAENRVSVVTEPSPATPPSYRYIYDGEGRRVQKIASGGPTTNYVYDATGTLAAEYTSGPTASLSCTTCYLVQDTLGSTRLVLDATSGSVTALHDYLPFGEELASTVRPGSLYSGNDNPRQKFTGKERDVETGLDYFGARYLSSAQGRWTTPDPINVARARLLNPSNTQNKYAYAANNPLKFIDRDGEDITIFYRPPSGAGADFRHFFIAALDQRTGQTGFLDHYPKGGTDALGRGQGAFNLGSMQERGEQARAGAFATLTIQTSPEQAQKVIDQISKMLNGSAPGYSALSNNCTTVCEDVLRDLGLDFGDTLPTTYWEDVYRRYSRDVQDNPFKAFPFVSVPKTTGVEYGNPRNFGMDYTRLLFQLYLNQWSQQQQPKPRQACVTAGGETTCEAY